MAHPGRHALAEAVRHALEAPGSVGVSALADTQMGHAASAVAGSVNPNPLAVPPCRSAGCRVQAGRRPRRDTATIRRSASFRGLEAISLQSPG